MDRLEAIKRDTERIKEQRALAAKTDNPIEQALIAIEAVCDRIETEDYGELTKSELVLSMSLIYKIAHSCNPYHICHGAHDNLRKIKDEWYAHYCATEGV
jgi:hypothetical protein